MRPIIIGLVLLLLKHVDGFRTVFNRQRTAARAIFANNIGRGLPSLVNQITQAPEKITASVDARIKSVTKSVEETVDAVVYFPSNVTAKVQRTADDVKRVAAVPFTFFRGAVAVTQKVANALSGAPPPPSPQTEDTKPVKVPQKTALDVFEDVKESFYMTIDGVTAVTQGVVATAETIAALPTAIADANSKAALTATSIRQDLVQAQQSAALAVAAGKKQVEAIQAIARDPSIVVKGLAPTPSTLPPILPPPPPPVPVAALKKVAINPAEAATAAVDTLKVVATVATAVKGGLEVTVGAVGAAAAGAASLKQRIDKNLAAQGLAGNPSAPRREANSGKGPTPIPVPVPVAVPAATLTQQEMNAPAPVAAVAVAAPESVNAAPATVMAAEGAPDVAEDDVKGKVGTNTISGAKRSYGLGGGKPRAD